MVLSYTLKFFCITDQSTVNHHNVMFDCPLSHSELDSLCFLLSEYFSQRHHFNYNKLTFFTEFSKIVEVLKIEFKKQQNVGELQNILTYLLQDEFMSQIQYLKMSIQSVKGYVKTIENVDINAISLNCDECPVEKIYCNKCKTNYTSAAITLLDSSLQDGWEIFLRALFGMVLYVYVLSKTVMPNNTPFTSNDIMCNMVVMCFYNLLCDKATSFYWDKVACKPLIEECNKALSHFNKLEYLLYNLNSNTITKKPYIPFYNFIKNNCNIKPKNMSKVSSVLFTGFYLRLYLESSKTSDPFKLEVLNVLRVILKDEPEHKIYELWNKLSHIKNDLLTVILNNFMVPETYMKELFVKYDLDSFLYKPLEEFQKHRNE